jgi:Ni/Co efflux regulator RcnB
MKKLLVALIAAAFAATAFAQAPKSTEPAPATKTEKKSDKKAKAKGEKKAKAKSDKKSTDKKAGGMEKKDSK